MFGERFKGEPLGLKDMMGNEICEGDIVTVNGGDTYRCLKIVQYEWGGFHPFANPGWEDVSDPLNVIVVGSVYQSTFESVKERVNKAIIENSGPPIRSFYVDMSLKKLAKRLSYYDTMAFREDEHSHSYIQLIKEANE